MFRKTKYIPLGMLLFVFALTACGGVDNLTSGSSPTVTPDSLLVTTPSSSPISSPIAAEAKKEDNSVRAIGTHPDGCLLVKPASKASVVPLGAPSCYGLETDLSWLGGYEAVWESKSDGTLSKVMTFPLDFGIVQQSDIPVEMQMVTLGETKVFAYVPRYTDCHALETYLFGVSEGKAFPITFEMKSGQNWTNIGQLPHRPFVVTDDELILTGGYGAGQEFINVYHFRYDSKKRSMILQSTNQVKPNDIVYDKNERTRLFLPFHFLLF